MMKLITYPEKSSWPRWVKRPANENSTVEKIVRQILEQVKKSGDKAVERYTELYERKNIPAGNFISPQLKQAIRTAKKNIETFHASQASPVRKITTMPGVSCWQEARPIERVGLYIPGGTAPLFSTILMLAVPAKLAGCKEIILCCPSDHPAILYTAKLCGVNKIFKVGGAQAIAAMAFGTETIPKVDKIFGPGNSYVTMAKQLVQMEGVAIDMPAGPSELMIIADESANSSYVAADLLSQAEHGEDSQVILLTTSKKLAVDVRRSIKEQVGVLPRQHVAAKAISKSSIILLRSIREAIELSNLYAPEHLIIACLDPGKISNKINAAGSVFIGNWSPVSVGDYASGTNHTLPTNGFAAMYSGLSLESFQKRISFQRLTKQGLKNISNTVTTMAEAEGLDAHKHAVTIRLKK